MSREHRKEKVGTCDKETRRMPTRCSEIGDENMHRLDRVHPAQFRGVDMPAEMPGSAIARMFQTDTNGDARLLRCDAMHTDPQLLFAARSSDQIMLAREAGTS
jgi:hypothetical protein